MHRDKKLGLGLGILLVGVVAAFFFRIDRPPEPPQLADPQALDHQIAEATGGPYNEAASSRPERARLRAPDAEPDAAAWRTPAFVTAASGDSSRPAPNPIAAGDRQSVPESPSGASGDLRPPLAGAVVPEHNRDWFAAGEGASDEASASELSAANGIVLHRIRPGDTLSELAGRYLGSASRFMEIYTANRDVLRSPNDLPVGRTIHIPRSGRTAEESSPAPPPVRTTPPDDPRRAVRVSETSERDAASPEDDVPIHRAIERRTLNPSTQNGTSRSSSFDAPTGEEQPAPSLRFEPVRRSPLWPFGYRSLRSSHGDDPSRIGGRVLTQVPPPRQDAE